MVDEAARRRNNNVRDLSQLIALLKHVDAADENAHSQIHRAAGEDKKLVANLERQLPRRSKNDGEHAKRILCQLLKNGDGKAGRLSGAGVGAPNDVR